MLGDEHTRKSSRSRYRKTFVNLVATACSIYDLVSRSGEEMKALPMPGRIELA
jgi:hypothetical protein